MSNRVHRIAGISIVWISVGLPIHAGCHNKVCQVQVKAKESDDSCSTKYLTFKHAYRDEGLCGISLASSGQTVLWSAKKSSKLVVAVKGSTPNPCNPDFVPVADNIVACTLYDKTHYTAQFVFPLTITLDNLQPEDPLLIVDDVVQLTRDDIEFFKEILKEYKDFKKQHR